MNSLYEVKMQHTEEVLKDFIKFDNAVRHPMTKVHLCVLGIGFLVMGYLCRSQTLPMLVFGAIGLVLLILLLVRHRIAFKKLSLQDEEYENQSETHFVFGQKELVINNPTWDKAVDVKYAEISDMYKDDRYYYICKNNEELYLLPYTGFVVGDSEAFGGFLETKAERVWLPVKLPLKEKLKIMNEKRKMADKLHDEKIQQNKKKKGK